MGQIFQDHEGLDRIIQYWEAEKALKEARSQASGTHRIYVVLLDDAIKEDRWIYDDYDADLPAVYVGLTGLTVEERFENHLRGYKAGKGYVRDYGLRLLPELYEQFNPMSYSMAVQAESALAEKLRYEGYLVFGGH